MAKAGVDRGSAGPFQSSITRSVGTFYRTRGGEIDEGLSPELGEAAVALAERVAERVDRPARRAADGGTHDLAKPRTTSKPPSVLVIGGTGFIGHALVRRLIEDSHGVRVLARGSSSAAGLAELGAELEQGDFTDAEAVSHALRGIDTVFHLARGYGDTWAEYEKYDVTPTRRLAELCLDHGVSRLYYASSIAVYDAGRRSKSITENTKPVPAMLRANPYARSKAENENVLLELHRSDQLPVVIFRPGIVLGPGGSPYHWGIAAWPHSSVARL